MCFIYPTNIEQKGDIPFSSLFVHPPWQGGRMMRGETGERLYNIIKFITGNIWYIFDIFFPPNFYKKSYFIFMVDSSSATARGDGWCIVCDAKYFVVFDISVNIFFLIFFTRRWDFIFLLVCSSALSWGGGRGGEMIQGRGECSCQDKLLSSAKMSKVWNKNFTNIKDIVSKSSLSKLRWEGGVKFYVQIHFYPFIAKVIPNWISISI